MALSTILARVYQIPRKMLQKVDRHPYSYLRESRRAANAAKGSRGCSREHLRLQRLVAMMMMSTTTILANISFRKMTPSSSIHMHISHIFRGGGLRRRPP
jgi:hypothetical protein